MLENAFINLLNSCSLKLNLNALAILSWSTLNEEATSLTKLLLSSPTVVKILTFILASNIPSAILLPVKLTTLDFKNISKELLIKSLLNNTLTSVPSLKELSFAE